MSRHGRMESDPRHIEFLRRMVNFCKEEGINPNPYDDELAEAKRAYRANLRKKEDRKKFCGGLIVNGGGDWDYCWYKIFFKGEHWTDEKKDQFRAAIWQPYRPTYYDCTGQIFTSFVEVFNVPSGVVVYVREDMDV